MRRIENARNAFFDEESFDTNNFLSFRTEDTYLQSEKFRDCTLKNGTWETILKQVFLFFPGTFILYFLGVFSPIMLVEFFAIRHRRISFFEVIFLICILLAATLMTWLGLGDVRKPKHFIIPASIFSVGVLWIAIIGILSAVFGYFWKYNSDLFIYLFPLALIVPFLAKGWVDRDS